MKKIGIITYHFARNYGAVLQCFALQSYLESKGYEVTIINHVNKNQELNNGIYKKKNGIKGIIINLMLSPFLIVRIKKNNKFENFINKYLKLSKKISNTEEMEKLINYEKFDMLISGSDQVFNPNIEDFDISFLFPFETKCKKISYAASIGNATESDLNKLKKDLIDFYNLSIREKQDEELVRKVTGKDVHVVCDPVLLMDEKFWSVVAQKSNLIKSEEKYLLCYFLHKNLYKKEFELAKKIAKEKKLNIKIINARYSIESLRKGTYHTVDPLEYIELFKKATYICTDSFHGTVFSIIFNKDFNCFDSKNNKKDSRRKNVLEQIGLLDRLCLIEDNQININEIDFSDINSNVRRISDESKVFLEKQDEK